MAEELRQEELRRKRRAERQLLESALEQQHCILRGRRMFLRFLTVE